MKRKTRKQKKAETPQGKPKRSKYALKVRARERFLDAGGTWEEWLAKRNRQRG